jgi:zinc transporter 9
MGVLVGTSLIVIIPEGIEAVYTSGEAGNLHTRRGHALGEGLEVRWLNGVHTIIKSDTPPMVRSEALHTIKASPEPILHKAGGIVKSSSNENIKMAIAQEATGTTPSTSPPTEPPSKLGEAPSPPQSRPDPSHADDHDDPPTFYIGFSLILGFILMFLIDKLPRHASEHITPPPPTRHISLDNLSQDLHASGDEESESFLQSLAPTPKQSRSLATTTGLVIHAAADGIAMGASASSSNTKLGFIIFVAIMIHKAPAAFGLTSVLLKQGLSKRAARGHLIIFSLAAPFGALTTWLLENILGGDHMEGERGQWWTGMLLLFSAGTFL